MILFIFILVYLISVAICLITCYYESKDTIHDIGDLLDETECFMWCPILNTGLVVLFGLCLIIVTLWIFFRLDILWEKFRNIKIKNIENEVVMSHRVTQITNKELQDLLKQYPDDAIVAIEYCNIKELRYNEGRNLIEID